MSTGRTVSGYLDNSVVSRSTDGTEHSLEAIPITIKGTNNGSIQDTTEWDTVERERGRIPFTGALLLLVRYDVGVSVRKNTVQRHLLDVLVLMAQQLRTDSIIFYVEALTDMGRKKMVPSEQTCDRDDDYTEVDLASYLVIQLTEAPLQVEGARVHKLGKHLQMCN